MKDDLAEYNTVQNFELDKSLHFSDFDLIHKGILQSTGPNGATWNRRKFLFIVERDNDRFEISWSTGHYSPTSFTIQGKDFELILGGYFEYKEDGSKFFVALKEGELIVSSFPALSE